ncbi:MAG: hypothetical protein FWC83_02630 [Alphaproteobacteria bacterium]|nr:hypothetical protein [Alphaproteobacteria bacterium]
MKTKIIYISGGENFAPEQVRAAFDEIRENLGLPSDMIMFGVPIDCAEGTAADSKEQIAKSKEVVEIEKSSIKKSSPILSVITAASAPIIEQAPVIEEMPVPIAATIVAEGVIEVAEEITLTDAPAAQTIEELLEGLAPVAQDTKIDITTETVGMDTHESLGEIEDLSDTDAALSKLATEFIEAEKLPAPKSKGGRIGKLKNVLPFKKKQDSEEPSLLGDLFGWAGVAANEDDGYSSVDDFFRLGNR